MILVLRYCRKHIVMFLFDSRNRCPFRGISVYLGFDTSGIGIRNPSASVMIVGVSGSNVNVMRHVLRHRAVLRDGVVVAGSPTRQSMSNRPPGVRVAEFWDKIEICMDLLTRSTYILASKLVPEGRSRDKLMVIRAH